MATEDICKDYASSLEDLTFNSKPLINVLTMLAEENSQHAAEIVKLIEKRIYEVKISIQELLVFNKEKPTNCLSSAILACSFSW